MKTKLFLAALSLIWLLLAVVPLQAQTVIWDRKAFGQQFAYPCGGTYNWPNNNAWTQDQLIAPTSPCTGSYEAEPSNWSTPNYPNGASVDVILGNGGSAPTNLDRGAPITVHSVTLLNVGGLTAEYGSRLTASLFDFQGDGSLPAAGGGGPNPLFTLASGGTLKKTGGSGTYAFTLGVVLQVLNGGTIASQAGTLQLPAFASAYAGGVNFNASAGAVIDLAPPEAVDSGSVQITGLFTGSNVGGTVRLKEGYLTTVFGSGGATFDFGGDTFQWQSGAIGSSPADPFINAGTMNITGAAFLHGQGFTNQGVLAQSGAGAFNVPFGRVLTNAASGTFDIRNNNGLTGIGGGGGNPVFNNSGTLRKSAGTGTSVIDRNITFNNIHGTIQVDTGTLVLAGGLTTRGGTGDGGTLVVAPGATLQLTDGTNDAVYHGTYMGSGEGTVLLSGGNLAPDVFNTGLTFNFPGSMFQWTGGAIGGYQSAVPVTNAGTMTVAGSANKATYGNFNNNGTLIHTGSGSLAVSAPNGGGSFSNNPGATYDLQSDADVAYGAGLNNFGLLKKSGGAGISAVEAPFQNAGAVEVNSGTIQFAQFNQTGGMINLNGGNLTFTNEAVFGGGSVVGTGTISGNVRNNGATFAPGFSPGKITVSGNYTQGANGILTLEIGGAAPGTQYDQLQVSGTAALAGTLNVSAINGFQPAQGDTFQLLAGGSFTGAFSTINTTGFTGAVTYTSSGITLTVTSSPSPTPSPTATPSPTPTPTPTPAMAPAQLQNISTRMHVGTDPNQLIGGFIVTGSEPKKVVVLATGPSLAAFDLTGLLEDPVLELYQGNTLIASNDNWKIPAQAEIEATGITPSHDLESALVRTLAPGAYTAIVRGTNGTGVGTVQLYDLAPTSNSKLANISSRGFVQVADDRVMIAGFIVGGDVGASSGIIVRAIAPSLSSVIPGVVPDPTLELKDANGSTLVFNDDWQQSPAAADISARGFAPSSTLESAVGVSLPNGAYTAIVRGKNGETGVAVVEVYNVN